MNFRLALVLLQGNKPSPNVTHSFKHFILTVEAEDYQNYNEDENDFVAGKFQLTGDVKTKVSEECPNTVTHASSIQKSEIQVFWTAPKVGSGCVVFRLVILQLVVFERIIDVLTVNTSLIVINCHTLTQ